MQNYPEHILIFKSNIKTKEDKRRVSTLLDIHPFVQDWSVDLSDCDYVLRIITEQLTRTNVVDMIERCGYHCEEMTD